MAYDVEIHRAAQKQLLFLPREAQIAIAKTIDGLRQNARPAGCRKLRGAELWRVRVGRYRVVYAIDDENKLVTVLKAAIRREDTY
ncbi:MAG: type II toxin-antitoxin system RelE/ParE family toxin [Chloroflexi bacterium]|nr:type II toxin-antitoxin system RelE/ParE family toxin [Chloroflexota bacterium]